MLKVLICCLLCFPVYALEFTTIKKNQHDQREYQGITLANGLKVLLISDRTLEKSAAALDVAIGSLADPDEYLGLAHFLEHMLSLGSSKYPESDSYLNFMSAHGGSDNAWTSSEHTQYFFNIPNDYFEQALERFAQCFISPLFKQEMLDKERQAVDAEYLLKSQDDKRRIFRVIAATSNPTHPFQRFSAGNAASLSDKSGNPSVRESLLEFYHRYYSADKMALVLAGPQKLKQLKAMVLKHFSELPVRANDVKPLSTLALDHEFAQDLEIKTLGDINQLDLLFKLKNQQQDYKHKSLQFIIYLLQQTGPGSLHEILLRNNWIVDLSVSNSHLTQTQDLLQINFALTALGSKHVDDITKITLQYIRYLSENAIVPQLFADLKKAGMRNARYRAAQSELALVSKYIADLHQLPISDVVLADDFTLATSFDPVAVQELLAQLNAHNMRRVYAHKDANPKLTEPWYKIAYNLTPYTKAQLLTWSQETKYEFALPLENTWLPDNFNIQPVSGNISVPGLILQSKGLQVWHKQDNRFKIPKVAVKFLLRGAHLQDSPETTLKLALTACALQDKLQKYATSAQLAGVHYAISPDPQGLLIELYMFSDKIKEVLEVIAQAIIHLSDERFETYKSEIKRQLINQQAQIPYVQAINHLRHVITTPDWSPRQQLAKIDNITPEEILDFSSKLIMNTKITSLITGNVSDVQAVSLAKFFAAKINSVVLEDTVYSVMPQLQAYEVGTCYGLEFNAKHSDHLLLNYVQASESGLVPMAKMMLLQTIIDGPMYQQLRTEEQLGYLVSSSLYSVKNRPGIIFALESPNTNPVILNQRLNNFFKSYQFKIDAMTNAELDKYKSSLRVKLLEKPKSIISEANALWAKIIDGTNDFNLNKELAAKLESIKLQDVRNYYNYSLVTNQRSANVAVYTAISEKSLAPNYLPIDDKS